MVTPNDLLDALRDYMSVQSGEGFTCPELAAQLGCGVQPMQAAMKRLLADGKAEVVVVQRPRMNGVTASVRGYRLRVSGPVG